jgi:hypothetical protein
LRIDDILWVKRGQPWNESGSHCHYSDCEFNPFLAFTAGYVVPKSRVDRNAVEKLAAACPARDGDEEERGMNSDQLEALRPPHVRGTRRHLLAVLTALSGVATLTGPRA